MASSENLLAIASHLHNLESALSNVIIEALIKIGSLAESKLFVIVETTEGRKYGGHSQLIDAFKSYQLFPHQGDSHMDIDMDSHLRHSFDINPENLCPDFDCMETVSPLRDDLFPEGAAASDLNHTPNANRGSPAKRSANSVVSENKSKRRRLHSNPVLPPSGPLEDLNEIMMGEAWTLATNASTCAIEGDSVSEVKQEFMEPNGLTPEVEEFLKGWDLNVYLRENSKGLEVRRSDFNWMALTRKGTPEYKLVSSLMYDIAKQVADCLPPDRESRSQAVNHIFDEFLIAHPRFKTLSEEREEVRTRDDSQSGKVERFRAHWRGVLYDDLRVLQKRSIARSQRNTNIPCLNY